MGRLGGVLDDVRKWDGAARAQLRRVFRVMRWGRDGRAELQRRCDCERCGVVWLGCARVSAGCVHQWRRTAWFGVTVAMGFARDGATICGWVFFFVLFFPPLD